MAITDGYSIACTDENRRGGLKHVWITERENITTFTAGTDHEYSTVTLDSTAVKFYLFEVDDFTASAVGEGADEKGSKIINHTLNFKVPKLEKVKAKHYQELFNTCKVVVIFADYNNKFFVLGWDEFLGEKAACRVVISENIGAGLTDEDGYTITAKGVSGELLREFSGDTTSAVQFQQPS